MDLEISSLPLIGDKVIIPTASDEKTAENRIKEFENYDWWFCHKKIGLKSGKSSKGGKND